MTRPHSAQGDRSNHYGDYGNENADDDDHTWAGAVDSLDEDDGDQDDDYNHDET